MRVYSDIDEDIRKELCEWYCEEYYDEIKGALKCVPGITKLQVADAVLRACFMGTANSLKQFKTIFAEEYHRKDIKKMSLEQFEAEIEGKYDSCTIGTKTYYFYFE